MSYGLINKRFREIEKYHTNESYRLNKIKQVEEARQKRRLQLKPEFLKGATKQCTCCKDFFPVKDFYRCSASKDGLDIYHKECRNEIQKHARAKRRLKMKTDFSYRYAVYEKRKEHRIKKAIELKGGRK